MLCQSLKIHKSEKAAFLDDSRDSKEVEREIHEMAKKYSTENQATEPSKKRSIDLAQKNEQRRSSGGKKKTRKSAKLTNKIQKQVSKDSADSFERDEGQNLDSLIDNILQGDDSFKQK